MPALFLCAPRHRRDVGPVAAFARWRGGREDDDENHASNSYPCLSARRQNGVQGVIETFVTSPLPDSHYTSYICTHLTLLYRHREDPKSSRRGQRAEEGRREAAGPRRAEDGPHGRRLSSVTRRVF